MELYLFI